MTSLIAEKDPSPIRDGTVNRRDVARLIKSISAAGYAHIDGSISSEEFESISQQLGSIVYRTKLQIAEGRKSVVYKHDEIGFHTDNPNVYIIGWHCIRQDESDGSSKLLDTRDIEQHFSRTELSILETIKLRCPDLALHDPDAGKEAYFLTPLASLRGSTPQVYFARWLLLSSYDESQTMMLDKFVRYLSRKEEHELINVRLTEGQALFINNRRLLHGRGAIALNSSRLIERVWITEPQNSWL